MDPQITESLAFFQSELTAATAYLAQRRAEYEGTSPSAANRQTRSTQFAAIAAAEADVTQAKADLDAYIAREHNDARKAERARGRGQLQAMVQNAKAQAPAWKEFRDLLLKAKAAAEKLTEQSGEANNLLRAAQRAEIGSRSVANDPHLAHRVTQLVPFTNGGPLVAAEIAELIRDLVNATPCAGQLNRIFDGGFSFSSASSRTDLVAAHAESVRRLQDHQGLCAEPVTVDTRQADDDRRADARLMRETFGRA
jgi:hypothetical protein